MKTKIKLYVPLLFVVVSMLACNLPATQQPATETPDYVATLTAIPLLAGTPTPVTPTATVCQPTITTNQDSNVRKGPSQAYDKLGYLPQGSSAPLAGKSPDGTWWYIQFAGGENGYGWISGAIVTANCLPTTIAVIAPPPLPVSQPKKTKTPKPSDNNNNNPTATPTQQSQPNNNPTATPTQQSQPNNTGEVLFKLEFGSVWYCGAQPMVSAKIYNIGSTPIESTMSSVEAKGTYINTTGNANNSPFKSSGTESEPNCTQTTGGQSSLAPNGNGFIHISIASVPAAGTQGFLYVEACSDNNHNGKCLGQFVNFNF